MWETYLYSLFLKIKVFPENIGIRLEHPNRRVARVLEYVKPDHHKNMDEVQGEKRRKWNQTNIKHGEKKFNQESLIEYYTNYTARVTLMPKTTTSGTNTRISVITPVGESDNPLIKNRPG